MNPKIWLLMGRMPVVEAIYAADKHDLTAIIYQTLRQDLLWRSYPINHTQTEEIQKKPGVLLWRFKQLPKNIQQLWLKFANSHLISWEEYETTFYDLAYELNQQIPNEQFDFNELNSWDYSEQCEQVVRQWADKISKKFIIQDTDVIAFQLQ
ncbi:hypothetical protein [Stenoxybacter acetivorans]|uniref:hypothetical protein n=1 Tax=Stenoxybacter acetivorans TaxID=422441 RepID=UPI00056540B1|nr:hypothetical protein [Stenoxybacter acetivorans]